MITITEKGERAAFEVLREREGFEDSDLLGDMGFLKRKLTEKFISNMKFEKSERGFVVDFKKRASGIVSRSKEVIKYSMARHEALLHVDYEIKVTTK